MFLRMPAPASPISPGTGLASAQDAGSCVKTHVQNATISWQRLSSRTERFICMF
jgi:hypothetical protein